MLLNFVLRLVVNSPALIQPYDVNCFVGAISVSVNTLNAELFTMHFIFVISLTMYMSIRTTHLDLPFINRRAFLHSSLCYTPPSTKPLLYLRGKSKCIFIPLKWLGLKWLEVFFMLDCFQSCIIYIFGLKALQRLSSSCHKCKPSLWPFIFLGHCLSHSVFCQRNLYKLKHQCSIYCNAWGICCWFPFFHS